MKVALELGWSAIGIELYPSYREIIAMRVRLLVASDIIETGRNR